MTDRIIAFSILCLVFGLPLGVAALFTGELILDFVFFWPLFMSVLWITGGLYFWFQLERHWSWDKDTPAPTLAGEPLISILIPCFNEGRNARETISAALDQRYENIEVIAINDGSSDNTAQVLQELAQEQPRLTGNITINERPSARWGSWITITANQYVIYQTFLFPTKIDFDKNVALALAQSEDAINRLQIDKALLSTSDLAKDEF